MEISFLHISPTKYIGTIKVFYKKIIIARINELEKQLREARQEQSGDKDLTEKVTELEISAAIKEEEKGNLQLRIMELEEAISSEVCYFFLLNQKY